MAQIGPTAKEEKQSRQANRGTPSGGWKRDAAVGRSAAAGSTKKPWCREAPGLRYSRTDRLVNLRQSHDTTRRGKWQPGWGRFSRKTGRTRAYVRVRPGAPWQGNENARRMRAPVFGHLARAFDRVRPGTASGVPFGSRVARRFQRCPTWRQTATRASGISQATGGRDQLAGPIENRPQAESLPHIEPLRGAKSLVQGSSRGAKGRMDSGARARRLRGRSGYFLARLKNSVSYTTTLFFCRSAMAFCPSSACTRFSRSALTSSKDLTASTLTMW